MKCYLFVAPCILSLFSCSVTAPSSSIDKIDGIAPTRWAATAEAKAGIDHDWVKRFKDVELNRLVSIAIDSAPDMRVAKERIDQARRDIALAGVRRKPTLDLNASTNRNKANFFVGDFTSSGISTPSNLSFDVAWEPDVWGLARAGQSASIGEYQAQSAEFNAAKALLAANICRAWFELAEAKEQLSLAEQALKIRRDTVETIQQRFEQDLAGDGGSSSDLRLAQTDVATNKAMVSQRKGEVEASKRQLELLTGRYPAAKIKGRSKVPVIGASPPVGLPSELLLRRPDIIAAERRLASRGKLIKQAKLAVYPSFPLTASVGTSAPQLSNVLKSSFGVWAIAANLAQPILTGGRVEAELNKRKAEEREAVAALQSTVLTAFGEVEAALAGERWLYKRIVDYKEALRLAEEASKAAEEDYAAGTADALTLFNTQSRRIELASQLTTLRRLRADTRVSLHLALGGGFKISDK